MGIVIAVVCLGAGLNLALFIALLRALGALPQRIRRVVQAERTESEKRALTALEEAAAIKVGTLVLGLRTYHDEFERSLKTQLAEAEVRARVAERRSSDARTVLTFASSLVSELRALIEDSSRLLSGSRASGVVELASPRPRAPVVGADTVRARSHDPVLQDDEPEEETTHVVPHPLPGVSAATKADRGPGGAT